MYSSGFILECGKKKFIRRFIKGKQEDINKDKMCITEQEHNGRKMCTKGQKTNEKNRWIPTVLSVACYI